MHPRYIFSSCAAVAEQKNLQAWRRMEGQEGAISRVNCLAAAVLRHDLNLYDFPSHWRDRPPWLVVLGVRQIPGLAATDCLLCGSQEALDDLRQHRLDRERVVRDRKERRVGEEGRSRWAPDHLKKKKKEYRV